MKAADIPMAANLVRQYTEARNLRWSLLTETALGKLWSTGRTVNVTVPVPYSRTEGAQLSLTEFGIAKMVEFAKDVMRTTSKDLTALGVEGYGKERLDQDMRPQNDPTDDLPTHARVGNGDRAAPAEA